MNKNFAEFLIASKDSGLNVQLLSNGMLLNSDYVELLVKVGVDVVSISFDASTSGDLYLCPCMGTKSVGNINEKGFFELWNCDDFIALRKSLAGEGEMLRECRRCIVGNSLSSEPVIEHFICESFIQD